MLRYRSATHTRLLSTYIMQQACCSVRISIQWDPLKLGFGMSGDKHRKAKAQSTKDINGPIRLGASFLGIQDGAT